MSILKQCGQEATLLIEYDVSVMGQSAGVARDFQFCDVEICKNSVSFPSFRLCCHGIGATPG